MFELEFSRKAEKYYCSADEKTVRILNRCLEIIAKNPFYHANIKKLHGEFEGSYRYRSGNLRVVYSVNEEEKIVYIEIITDRGMSYR
ncbi:MAG: hypothetical protein AYP45_05475 [Candidatus Brocadia carolinensis]|uniref:Plasmid stabilization protein n=1 Tax=Candidatus Brocadia carolinensis TaxID=1004156 RepID=A0A1V4AVF9_9BACT|nr:MAG: hypothetical protein AYP45_05475 [Candidatus Brocadia caroliniensis]